MIEWKMRPKEFAFNVNPAFCGEILYYVIEEHNKKVNDGFQAIYLPFIFPIIFDDRITKELKSTRSNFNVILKEYPYYRMNFAEKAETYLNVMIETMIFLTKLDVLKFERDKVFINQKIKTRVYSDETKHYINKGKILGKVLANENEPANLYYLWGIKL